MNAFPTDDKLSGPGNFLPWLVDMGADEVVLDQPVNRFLTPPPVLEAGLEVVKTIPVPQRLPSAPKRNFAIQPATHQDGSGLAAECSSIADIVKAFSGFDSHPLKPTATRLCFVSGAATSRILVLCDKPRSEEDRSGEVLAGKHQVLAERMLAAIGLSGVAARDGYEQVTLANFMPWRPPGNRALVESEGQLVMPLIKRFVELLAPQLILCLGPLAGQFLAGGEESPVRARGKWLRLETLAGVVPMLTTFHPETLLKSPQSKRLVWQDLQAFRQRIAAL